jgi:hypothetical protein
MRLSKACPFQVEKVDSSLRASDHSSNIAFLSSFSAFKFEVSLLFIFTAELFLRILTQITSCSSNLKLKPIKYY